MSLLIAKPSSQRSALMASVHRQNTAPELIVRKSLRILGYSYSLHSRKLPGTPDIVIRSHKIIFFVHGCFWHRHQRCKYTSTPKTNRKFWLDKFSSNKARDKSVALKLKELGWTVFTIWQCQTKDFSKLTKKIAGLLSSPMEISSCRNSSSAPALKPKTKKGAAKKRQ